MFPKHFTLKNDHDDHFELHDSRDNKTFKVAKKGLHPAHQVKVLRHLQKFAEGGEVKPGEVKVPDYVKDEVTVAKPEDDPVYQQLLAGQTAQSNPQRDRVYGSPQEQALNDYYKVQQMKANPGGMSLHESSRLKGLTEQSQPAARMPDTDVAPDMPQEEAPQLPETSQAVSPAAQGALPQSQGGVGMDSMGMVGRYERAVMQGAQGQIDQNQEIAKLHEERNKLMEQSVAVAQQNQQVMQSQLQELAQGIASFKVDPERLWNSKSNGAKFGTALSVMLGGLGAGLQGTTHNAALEMLQKSVDQDIESQKTELGKKQTLLSDNLRIMGSLQAAESATRAQYEALFQGKLSQLVAKTNSPIIQAQAQQAIMESKVKMMHYLQPVMQAQQKQVMQQQVLQGVLKGTIKPELAIDTLVPAELQKQAYTELGDYRHIKTQLEQVDHVMNGIIKTNTLGNRVMSPIQSKIKIDQAEAQLFPIVKAIVGERMTDADARTLIKPYVVGVFSSNKTGKNSTEELKRALVAQSKGKTPILSTHIPGFGKDIIEAGAPTKTVNGVTYRKKSGG